MNLIPNSLICCNGSRLSCQQSADRRGQMLGISLCIVVCFTFIFIIHIENHNANRTAEIKSRYLSKSNLVSFSEVTDLSDDTLSYAVVFDCGSSGTRVYIYFWPLHSGNPRELLDIHQVIGTNGKPLSKKISPGLSSHNQSPELSAESLQELLQFAADTIPSHKHQQTPLYILATAGMRLISQSEAHAIIEDIIKDIPKWSDFHFEASHVEILSGKDEGKYAWISLNYMLGRFSHAPDPALASIQPTGEENSNHFRKPTVGVLDMGGGSFQIAFELPDSVTVKNNRLVSHLNLGCKDGDSDHIYNIYVTTFLGFGANSAMKRYRQMLVSLLNGTYISADDCLPYGLVEEFYHNGAHYYLQGTGNVSACQQHIIPLLNKSVECKVDPCSINGVHQPLLPHSLTFYGISEYWYSLYDVFFLQGQYKAENVTSYAKSYCKTSWNKTMERYRKRLYPHADIARLKNECFKVSWIMAALHQGLGFPLNYTGLTSVNQIQGQEVQWSLGALIHKTRYFPLRSQTGETNKSWLNHSGEALVPYILVLCISIVLAAILLYCRHLQRMKVVPSLKGVPSMSYFMTESDEMKQGLIEERQYFP